MSKKETHRSMENMQKLRKSSTLMQSTDFQHRCKGEMVICTMNCGGITQHSHIKKKNKDFTCLTKSQQIIGLYIKCETKTYRIKQGKVDTTLCLVVSFRYNNKSTIMVKLLTSLDLINFTFIFLPQICIPNHIYSQQA